MRTACALYVVLALFARQSSLLYLRQGKKDALTHSPAVCILATLLRSSLHKRHGLPISADEHYYSPAVSNMRNEVEGVNQVISSLIQVENIDVKTMAYEKRKANKPAQC